jgi:hypothetical protein
MSFFSFRDHTRSQIQGRPIAQGFGMFVGIFIFNNFTIYFDHIFPFSDSFLIFPSLLNQLHVLSLSLETNKNLNQTKGTILRQLLAYQLSLYRINLILPSPAAINCK